jgi:magnesium transporter
VTRSQRDVCASLSRSSHPAITRESLPYLRDVYDHVLRLYEMLESAREGLAMTRDAYLSVVNNRLSEIMRTLTIITTILMPLTVLAGIYGMNFEHLPLHDSPWGFPLMLGAMAVVAGLMAMWFRARRWF